MSRGLGDVYKRQVLVGTANVIAIENPIYGIAALAFLLPAEKILKQIQNSME